MSRPRPKTAFKQRLCSPVNNEELKTAFIEKTKSQLNIATLAQLNKQNIFSHKKPVPSSLIDSDVTSINWTNYQERVENG